MTRPRPDVELLAALDAGALDVGGMDADRAREALADPAARPVLDALAATRAELARLADPPVPPVVAARWSAALRAELDRLGAPPSPDGREGGPLPSAGSPDEHGVAEAGSADRAEGPGFAAGRRRPDGGTRGPGGRRRARRRPAVIAAVALLVVLAAAAVVHQVTGTADKTLLVGEAMRSFGIHDAGAYADDARRAACLTTLAPPDTTPTAPLLGGRQVTFGGRPGVLLVLGTGRRGVLDIVVVDPGCTTLLAAGRMGG